MTQLTVPVSERDHVQGPENAPVTLLQYGDYECSHCKQAHFIIKQIQKHLGDQLRFVFRYFPIPVVNLAKHQGWNVTVVDDRPGYTTAERFPLADKIIFSDPQAIHNHHFLTPRTADRGYVLHSPV